MLKPHFGFQSIEYGLDEKRLRGMILSASGMRSFRMLRRMLVMRSSPAARVW